MFFNFGGETSVLRQLCSNKKQHDSITNLIHLMILDFKIGMSTQRIHSIIGSSDFCDLLGSSLTEEYFREYFGSKRFST